MLNTCSTIIDPGAYVVGRNLAATGDCFVIAADYVNVDLDGFVLTGNGSGSAFVEQLGVGRKGLSVRNGVVTAFANGVFMLNSTAMTIERMQFTSNASAAIRAGDTVTVSNSMILNNGFGIGVAQRALITANTVNENAGSGISVGIGSNVLGNAVGRNAQAGIFAAEGALVANNISRNNATYGVLMDCPGAVVGNTLSNNLTANLAQPGGTVCNVEGDCCLVNEHNSLINSF